MPVRAPHICACSQRVPSGMRCPCTRARDAERKARFDKTRPNSTQRGYDRKWEQARAVFLRHNPLCARCGARAKVVDHVIPHRGDQRLFWDQGNWAAMCTPCHSGAKQREERRNLRKA